MPPYWYILRHDFPLLSKERRLIWFLIGFAAATKSLQSCPTLCDPRDGSPPCSPVPGILQARTLEWVAISFSNAWKWKVKVKSLSCVRLLATPWTAAYQAPPSMGFSRQEYWSGVPLPSPNWRSGSIIPPFLFLFLKIVLTIQSILFFIQILELFVLVLWKMPLILWY